MLSYLIIGLVFCFVVAYYDYKEGVNLRLYHLPLYFIAWLSWPVFLLMAIYDILKPSLEMNWSRILIKGKKK